MIEKIPCEHCCWIYKAAKGSIIRVQCSRCGLFCDPQSEKSRDLVRQLQSCIEYGYVSICQTISDISAEIADIEWVKLPENGSKEV